MRSALEAKEKDLVALKEMLTARERVSYNTCYFPLTCRKKEKRAKCPGLNEA